MANAKAEFLNHIKDLPPVKAAVVTYDPDYGERVATYKLPAGYTPEQYDMFLAKLRRINYDDGFGGQELYGHIWYADDLTWSSRAEYDGSEWWQYYEIPDYVQHFASD